MKKRRPIITVEVDFSLEDAKRLMLKLIEDTGGCGDVFLDHREPDGLHEATAFDIRDFVLDCIRVSGVPTTRTRPQIKVAQ